MPKIDDLANRVGLYHAPTDVNYLFLEPNVTELGKIVNSMPLL